MRQRPPDQMTSTELANPDDGRGDASGDGADVAEVAIVDAHSAGSTIAPLAAIGITGAALVGILLLLPSENWASGRIAALLGNPDGAWVRLASLASAAALTVALLWLLAERPIRAHRRSFAIATALFVASGLVPILTTAITAGSVSLAVRDAWLGYAAPAAIIAGVVALSSTVARLLWTVFIAGWCVHLMVALAAVAGSATSAGWEALTPAGRLVMWKFEMLDTSMLFTRWIGNANKASNVLLLGLLLTPAMLGLRGRPGDEPRRVDAARIVAAAYLVLATVSLLLLFSRACLILLPFALVAGGWWRVFSSGTQRIGMALGAALLAGLLLGVPTVRNALLFGTYPNGESQGFLSTYISDGGRFDQAQDVFVDLSNGTNWLFGIGSGQYGMLAHGSADAGTHNYLLDAWLAGGLPALLLGLAWITACVLWSARRWREPDGLLGLVAIGMLFLLMTREYSASYLGALSMGGIYIMLVIATATGAIRPASAEREA